MRSIYCDLDGVLADLVGMVGYIYGADPTGPVTYDGIDEWLADRWLADGPDPSIFAGLSQKQWASIPPYPGALDFLSELQALGRVTIVTHAVGEAARAGKVEWLQYHAPDVPIAFIAPEFRQVLAAIDGAVLVDDRPATINMFDPARGFLVRRRWSPSGLEYGDILDKIRGLE